MQHIYEELNNAESSTSKERDSLLNQLQQLVCIMFPEFKMVIKDIKIKTARWILQELRHPTRLESLDKDRHAGWGWSSGRTGFRAGLRCSARMR